MTFDEKIEEWIKEAESRPGSALMILKLIAGRLRDLTERNDELLAENIALQNGRRVEEYQKRIAHLEFQLEMLKRRFGDDPGAQVGINAEKAALNLLVYNAQGRILRLAATSQALTGAAPLGQITGEAASGGEFPRLLAIPAEEQALLLFSSGRVSTLAVDSLPALEGGGSWGWDQAALPDEPHAGELLACVLPLSRLPVADFIVQVSRRGSVKKTLTSMGGTVLANHYLGRGAVNKADQAFNAGLSNKKERLALVSYEGRILCLEVDDLSYAAEERMRLDAADYIIASFVLGARESIVCLTQTGKVIQREGSLLEPAKSGLARGQAFIPPSRLEQGTRFVGAASVRDGDLLVVLDAQGKLSVHPARDLAGAGAVRGGGLFLSMGLIPAGDEKGAAA